MAHDRRLTSEENLARRTAYGLHPDSKTGALAPVSEAAMEAAFNLLDKALARMVDGAEEVAGKLISRAAALPFDEHLGLWPGPYTADQMLFDFLCSVAEDASLDQQDPDDHDYVEGLYDDIARVVPQLDDREGSVLRDIVETIVSDSKILGVSRAESEALAAAVRDLPDPEPAERALKLGRDADLAQREDLTRLVLGVLLTVIKTMNEADGFPDASL